MACKKDYKPCSFYCHRAGFALMQAMSHEKRAVSHRPCTSVYKYTTFFARKQALLKSPPGNVKTKSRKEAVLRILLFPAYHFRRKSLQQKRPARFFLFITIV